MARETTSVSELPVMQNKQIGLVLCLTLLTNLTLGQETATKDAAEIEESGITNQTGEEAAEPEVPTQFIPKETISPDSVIAFPADI